MLLSGRRDSSIEGFLVTSKIKWKEIVRVCQKVSHSVQTSRGKRGLLQKLCVFCEFFLNLQAHFRELHERRLATGQRRVHRFCSELDPEWDLEFFSADVCVQHYILHSADIRRWRFFVEVYAFVRTPPACTITVGLCLHTEADRTLFSFL